MSCLPSWNIMCRSPTWNAMSIFYHWHLLLPSPFRINVMRTKRLHIFKIQPMSWHPLTDQVVFLQRWPQFSSHTQKVHLGWHWHVSSILQQLQLSLSHIMLLGCNKSKNQSVPWEFLETFLVAKDRDSMALNMSLLFAYFCSRSTEGWLPYGTGWTSRHVWVVAEGKALLSATTVALAG